jgi:hypothetical protein
MAFNQFPSKGGIPSGNTAGRPSNPVIGDTYYNGEVGVLEIFDGNNFIICSAPPVAPTIATPTDASTGDAYTSTAGKLSVVFTPGTGGGLVAQYNALTTAGGHTASSSGTTVTITGLTPGTAYTVFGNAQNNFGTSVNSGNATAVTPTTKPQAPTIGTTTLSNGLPVVNWTLGNNGGKNLSAITITPYLNGTTAETSRTAATTSSTSYTFTSGQLTEDSSYTFKVKVTNANGDSPESSASNSVAPNETFTVDYLVVAGGGAGGSIAGSALSSAAGGAGGLRSTVTATGGGGSLESALTITAGTNYTVTVGAGGATTAWQNPGGSGGNSVFSTITSTGGGGGGRYDNGAGQTGGSGGGGAHGNVGGTGGARTASPVQGNNGGNGSVDNGLGSGGGGGGAGAVGGNGTTGSRAAAGNGGNGAAVSITGSSVTYAGGGGGGRCGTGVSTGGTGGGGAGADADTPGVAGTVNTGGGGGGGSYDVVSRAQAAGGSGVVILRYPDTTTITIGAGLTGTESSASGGYKRATLTAGSGNVSWS